MPEIGNKIHPLLMTVGAGRAVEKFVGTGPSFIEQRDEIVLQRHRCFHIQVVLAAEQL
jgi:hypothetical protein